ncbi:DUF1146 family protein [Metabacillus iocasae]|uniref:Integral membrane protein (TIGR02327 family) n=1 Tax=Priestia iocasae TaxID=2291674 RepID=A0ABS2QX37_9BACI|nr:putative integral membrane protein (TIGR02327 family) [Metabacillus iocasae]
MLLPGAGSQALLGIISHLFFIVITWYALQGFQIEKMMKPNRVMQGRLMMILLTIAIGSAVSNFFLDYLFWSQRLSSLF